MKATRDDHPSEFIGDKEDLDRFRTLVETPIRRGERESALHAWAEYKLHKQMQHIRNGKMDGLRKSGTWKKGDYVRSLTAPAIDLRGAVFENLCLGYADLRGVRFDGCRFTTTSERGWFAMKGAKLEHSSFVGAEMRGARLMEANLRYADLRRADLRGADLSQANLEGADLRDAILREVNLERANLVGARLEGADLCGSRVYGAAVWDVSVDAKEDLRRDLIVTPIGSPEVRVDNVEVAQFVYLLLTNPKIRDVIDTVCKKGVLILGRFTTDRKRVLDALRDELRRRGYVSMIFDFEKPSERNFTETVKTLAALSRFIIADVTTPKSSPQELEAIKSAFMVPIVPICVSGQVPAELIADLQSECDWVLDPLEYSNLEELIGVIEPAIIGPALEKHAELLSKRARTIRTRKASQYKGE